MGTRIDINGAPAQSRKHAVVAQRHLFSRGSAGQTRQQHIGTHRGLTRRVTPSGPGGFEIVPDLTPQIMDGQFIPGLQDVGRHRMAHPPQTDESDFHAEPSVRGPPRK